MSANVVSVLERESEDLLRDLAALLGGAADVDGIRIYQSDVGDDGDLRVVLIDAEDNGRAVYLRMMTETSHTEPTAQLAAPTDPGLTVRTDLGDYISLAWLRSKGLLR